MPLFEKDDGRHYNIHRLNKIFAVSSILLFVTVIWLVLDDHGREWKDYQRDFRQMEIAKLDAILNGGTGEAENADQPRPTQESAMEDDPFADADPFAEEDPFADASSEPMVDADPFADAAEAEPFDETDGEPAVDDESGLPIPSLTPEERAAAERQLRELKPAENGWAHRLAQRIRNLPFLDFADPEYRIEQVVVENMTEDLNFALVPRVDRCMTCHQGVLRPEFAGDPNPFASHPNPDLFLSSRSPHPLDDFGCTSCHKGHGRGTTFATAAHEPKDDKQRARWSDQYGWTHFEDTKANMYPRKFVEASCYKCHAGHVDLEGADRLTRGLQLIEQAGCYGCHVVPRMENLPKPGPSLKGLRDKTTRAWVTEWLRNPRAMRHDTWMPAFFPDPDSPQAEAEIALITEFLFQRSTTSSGTFVPHGDAARGRELLDSVGCLGCHIGPEESVQGRATRTEQPRRHGPGLTDLGAKTSSAWLYAWLKNPHAYDPETSMPNMRLSDQEAADLVSYLIGGNDGETEEDVSPDLKAAVGAVAPVYTASRLQGTYAVRDLESKPVPEQVELLGGYLVRHYGCVGCHDIAGFEDAVPIGPELSTIGSKATHDFDFGSRHDIPHANYAWISEKLRNPRSFERANAVAPDQRLRMPQYALGQEELDAITTALLAFVDTRPSTPLHEKRTAEAEAIDRGRELIRQLNCRACHIIEGQGGAIGPVVADWLVRTGLAGADSAAAMAPSFSPPNLIGEGEKVNAEWLYQYLDEPTVIRPWLKVRMPSYALTADQRDKLVTYFAQRDGRNVFFGEAHQFVTEGPLYDAGQKLFSADYFDCGNCHIQGGQLPEGTPDRWAPDFALSFQRLRPEWVREWLYDPQRLLPGTKMPTYFDPEYFDEAGPDDILDGDEHRQIDALTNYVFAFGLRGHDAPAVQAEAVDSPVENADQGPSGVFD